MYVQNPVDWFGMSIEDADSFRRRLAQQVKVNNLLTDFRRMLRFDLPALQPTRWQGAAADAYRDRLHQLHRELLACAWRLEEASAALTC